MKVSLSVIAYLLCIPILSRLCLCVSVLFPSPNADMFTSFPLRNDLCRTSELCGGNVLSFTEYACRSHALSAGTQSILLHQVCLRSCLVIITIRLRLRLCVPVPLSSGNVGRTWLVCLVGVTAHCVWIASGTSQRHRVPGLYPDASSVVSACPFCCRLVMSAILRD